MKAGVTDFVAGEKTTALTGNQVDKEWAFCQTPLGSLHYIK